MNKEEILKRITGKEVNGDLFFDPDKLVEFLAEQDDRIRKLEENIHCGYYECYCKKD